MAEDPVVQQGFELARITIVRELDDTGGDTIAVLVEPDDSPLMNLLGMLRMAEDTVLSMYEERHS